MRRVAAISAGPRSPRPRGRRALSLLDLSDLSAIIAQPRGARLVAAAPGSGKASITAPHRAPQQENIHAIATSAQSGRRSQRPRSLLAAVHIEPRIQGLPAP